MNETRLPALTRPAVIASMQSAKPIKVLIVEDSEFDARVLVNVLRQGGYEPEFKRVDTADTMRAALVSQRWDVVLSDYNMPGFNARGALEVLQSTGQDLPFLIISGGIGEDIAVAAMKAGAHDYLMKGSLARLIPAIERELREATTRKAQGLAEEALRENEMRYRMLWETSSDAVIIMDMNSRIQFANPAVEKIFGYLPEELIGRDLGVLIPPESRPLYHEGILNYMRTGVRSLDWKASEMPGLRKDGVVLQTEVSLGEMEWHGKKLFAGFIRDVTEKKRAEQELRETQEQFRVAREIQQRLFPKVAPALDRFDIAGASYPADAAGGDYFDYLAMLHDRVGIVVGDVTGHGIGPALLMAETRAYLRLLARNREDVGEILTRANLILSEDVDYERFVTVVIARLDPKSLELVYGSAGHPTCYVLDAASAIKAYLKRTGVPLGLKRETIYEAAPPIQLAPGDIILLVTDGIDEAMSGEGEFFGVDRTLEVLRRHRDQPAREIVQALYQAVKDFSHDTPQMDDITSIVVKVL